MKIRHNLVTLLILLTALGGCGAPPETDNFDPAKEVEAEKREPLKPLKFEELTGRWKLLYANNYGYDFRFYKNYRSLVILHLNNHALIFKGVYTIENENDIKINIYAMKRSPGKRLKLYGGFVKTKSSHFLFQGQVQARGKKPQLVVNPKRIVIDGNNSDGYFEPVIKLKKG